LFPAVEAASPAGGDLLRRLNLDSHVLKSVQLGLFQLFPAFLGIFRLFFEVLNLVKRGDDIIRAAQVITPLFLCQRKLLKAKGVLQTRPGRFVFPAGDRDGKGHRMNAEACGKEAVFRDRFQIMAQARLSWLWLFKQVGRE